MGLPSNASRRLAGATTAGHIYVIRSGKLVPLEVIATDFDGFGEGKFGEGLFGK
jgi:hypothetical protein